MDLVWWLSLVVALVGSIVWLWVSAAWYCLFRRAWPHTPLRVKIETISLEVVSLLLLLTTWYFVLSGESLFSLDPIYQIAVSW